MAGKPTGIRERCVEIINDVYTKEGIPVTTYRLAQETGKKPNAINDNLKALSKRGRIALFTMNARGQVQFAMPVNALLPMELMRKYRRPVNKNLSIRTFDDYGLLSRLADYYVEFAARDLTMNDLAQVVKDRYGHGE